MNSPPSNYFLYYNHNLHDPTFVNVHTLNPQPFKHHTPPSIPTFQSATAQYWASHPPFSHQQQTQQTHHSIPNIYTNNLFNHGPYQHCPDPSPSFTSSITNNLQPRNLTKQQPTQPLNSTTNLFNHGLYQHYPYSSPTFTSSLTSPNSNYINTQYSTLRSEPDPPPFCFKQQPTQPLNSTTTTDFLLQQMLQSQQTLNDAISKLASDISTLNKSLTPLTHSQHITQHATNRAQPTPLNITHTVDSFSKVDEKETVLVSDPVTKIIKEIAPMTNLLPEHSPSSLVTSLSPPPHISLSAVSKPTFTTEVVADCVLSISETYKKYTTTRFTPYSLSLYPNFEQSFSTITTSSLEKEVVYAVAETPKQHPNNTVELPVISIHIFDPGGKLSTTVCSVAHRCLPILSFRSFTMFTFATLLPAHQVLIVSLISLVWEPWDRGKKSFNYMNTFSLNRRRCRSFLNLGITGVVILQMVADTIWVTTIRLGPKEYTWIGSFNGMTSPSRILIVHGASVSN